ncbi:MAG: hypothetical protein K6C97_01595 [Treponema sp.]|nr:hypothetical protein [Treponema sp.]
MKKNKILAVLLLSIISFSFLSCGKKELENKLEFVEIDFTSNEEIDSNLNLLLSRTEVSQDLYLEVMEENPSEVVEGQLPVTNISFEDACRFCNKLNKIYGFKETYSIEERQGEKPRTQLINEEGFMLLKSDEAREICKYLTSPVFLRFRFNSRNM